MDRTVPFVVTVASEKGGVGKTTIATNLAVYLKALREDLPVTVASFDNHFSIDQMFAIGRHRGRSVAGLFAGVPAGELATLGEYGVQFLASERELVPPDDDPRHLGRALAGSGLDGILVLDTRPVLDYFTRNALLAADLVLVPVKDRPSLVNAASLLRALEEEDGGASRAWLLPSLIDARLKLRQEVGIREFLVFSARERGYQVLETFIAKSPKVEGLATSFSARVYPVLTHARGTAVHGQMRELAEFVLARRDAAAPSPGRWFPPPTGGTRRLVPRCPLCGEQAAGDGFLGQDLRGRRRRVLHPGCFSSLLEATELPPPGDGGILVLVLDGPGRTGPEATLSLYWFDGSGDGAGRAITDPKSPPFRALLQELTGRPPGDCYRELLWIALGPEPPAELLQGPGRRRFAALRRAVLRELLASGA